MELNEARLEALSQTVIGVVERAGEQVLSVYRRGEQGNQHVGLKTKPDDSPVTAADLAAHHVLNDELPGLLPDTPVVSEENEASLVHRLPTGRFWLVDPVDGTREFLARTDEFTVNVALIVDGQVRLGVVLAPVLGELYWGALSWGAWRRARGQTEQIRVTPYPSLDAAGKFSRPLRITASRSHMNDDTRRHIKRLQPQSLLRAGSSLNSVG